MHCIPYGQLTQCQLHQKKTLVRGNLFSIMPISSIKKIPLNEISELAIFDVFQCLLQKILCKCIHIKDL